MTSANSLGDVGVPARIVELERELAKVERINAALIGRVERSTDLQGNAFSLFETAILLESKVQKRTADLGRALDELAATNAALATARDLADEAQHRLRDAIESISEGFAIFDSEDRLVLCNQTYLGLWPGIADRIRPGVTFNKIAAMIGKDRASLGPLVAPGRWISERVAQHNVAMGSHVHALADGRWIQINELRTSEGGIVGVYTDITQLKAEDTRDRARELALKSATLQATLDNISDGVCVYDADRVLLAWNDPLLALLRLSPLAIRSLGQYGDLVARLGAASLEWLAKGSLPEIDQIAHRGHVLEVRRSAMPGDGMVVSLRDITERLRAAKALRETNESLELRVAERTADIAAVNSKLQQEIAERLAAEAALREAKTLAELANVSKTHFLAAASHDLLQPLNAARLFVAALGDRRLALPTRALVRQASAALDSVEDLLEALLEISKMDAGAIVPEPVDFSLVDLLKSMKTEFAPIARERGLGLFVQESRLWVRSDQRLLRRILQNFISNALHYTVSGSVRVSCVHIGEALRIAVTDTGPGIAEQHHVEIFEEFRRLHGSAQDRGMGLGLAIVQRASQMLGHQLYLKSQPNQGSTFGIDVPVGTPRALASDAVIPARSRLLKGQIVLVLDNEVAVLDGMSAVLSGWGCQSITAIDKKDALKEIARLGRMPDLIVADYHLDGDALGDRTVSSMRETWAENVPAIILTADRTPELREALVANGFYVLTKPVKLAQLRALFGHITSRSSNSGDQTKGVIPHIPNCQSHPNRIRS